MCFRSLGERRAEEGPRSVFGLGVKPANTFAAATLAEHQEARPVPWKSKGWKPAALGFAALGA